MPVLAFAYDRATANRHYDIDGRLRVERSVISRSEVSDYLAEEIVGWRSLGLTAGTLVPLFRDPDELRRATPAFNGLPLLSKHVPITASTHRHDLVCGVVMNPKWEDPDLVASLIVWAGDAIARIERADEQGVGAGLSAGYRYEVDMSPGSDGGVRFRGVMRRIIPNHVSLVDRGRVRGAFVADEAPATARECATRIAPGLLLTGIGHPPTNYLR
jgi:hypothetical protein